MNVNANPMLRATELVALALAALSFEPPTLTYDVLRQLALKDGSRGRTGR